MSGQAFKMTLTYFDQICSIENLELAYYKASKRKRSSNSYLYFRKNAEVNVQKIQEQLLIGKWQCGTYRQFKISDPKERIITAAPFEDRIVHHAIINVMEDLFEKKFIFHTYACRKQKGTHAALKHAQKFCRNGIFFLKLDVRKYFDSIDHKILKQQLLRLTNESKVQTLFGLIIDSYTSDIAKEKNLKTGLPIGNLTSQYFANLYLSGLDHFVLERLKPYGYIRYMDDMLIFSKSLKQFTLIFKEIEKYISSNLNLSLKPPVYGRSVLGIPFLGKLVKYKEIRPLAQKIKLKKKKIKKIDYLVRTGQIEEEKGAERINAIMADCRIKKMQESPSVESTIKKAY